MKTPILTVIALAMAIATPIMKADDKKPHQLRILCYNIHYGQGTDGVYDVERLAAVIKKTKPDLVALQEVDVGVKRSGRVHELQRLSELTGLAARYGPTQHYEGGLFGNAVLTNLPILNVVIQPLPYTEATAEKVTYPRGCVIVTVKAPNGKPLRFISTHFQHNVESDRVAEAKAINKLFTADDDQTPTILAGDMNATTDAEPVQVLQKKWTNSVDKAITPTVPSVKPTSRIDYIFYRPAANFKVLESKVIPEPLASDHRPVFAVLELTKE